MGLGRGVKRAVGLVELLPAAGLPERVPPCLWGAVSLSNSGTDCPPADGLLSSPGSSWPTAP